MNYFLSLLAVLFLASCAGSHESLTVKQFQLKNMDVGGVVEPSARMEILRHLHGAVTAEERASRQGQYYTVLWEDPAGQNQAPVEVFFEYQQGATASRVKGKKQTFAASDVKGKAEFAVIGQDFAVNGRVLAWKITLRRGDRIVATRQSYLWR
ncbi:MAG: hypothetical protein QM680_03330 [Luteolibacter sp.]